MRASRGRLSLCDTNGFSQRSYSEPAAVTAYATQSHRPLPYASSSGNTSGITTPRMGPRRECFNMTMNIRNQLLRFLAEPDLALVRPLLREVNLPRGMKLGEPGKKIDTVYFLESGICSVVVIGQNDQKTEAGHIGREGMAGSTLASEIDMSQNDTMMQVAGHGFAVSSDDFSDLLQECPSLRTAALHFTHSLYVQVSHTLLATARYKLHQRVGGSDLELTHDFLAMMLTVRRSGVTTELHILEGMRLIKARRGLVQVRDREGLIAAAAGSYGIPEREYARLFPEATSVEAMSSDRQDASRPPT
jgi:CRP-like cAMP-binding protein